MRFTSLAFTFLILSGAAHSGFLLAEEIRLQQADGAELILPGPAETVITLAPNLTELAFAAGIGGKIIATVEYSDFPAEAAQIPRVGDAFRLDLERILALRPDLVIAWQSGNPQAAVAYLESLGIATWTVEIRSPEDIATVLEDMGRMSGNPGQANAAAMIVRRRLQELSRDYAGLPPVSYFFQISENPLYTVNGEHLISRSLALCGGTNVFADAGSLAPTVTREAVIAVNPDVLMAPEEPAGQDPLAAWREWPKLRAVQNGALFLLPADAISQATPRLIDAVSQGCELMHRASDDGTR